MVSILKNLWSKEKAEQTKEREESDLVRKGIIVKKDNGDYAYNPKLLKRELMKQELSQEIKKVPNLLNPGVPTNIGKIQSKPQQIMSKSQAMLSSLFNSKNQFWGNGEPVRINQALTSGQGLLKTGDGDRTRRLFMP